MAARVRTSLKWNDKKVMGKTTSVVELSMRKATVFLRDEVKRKLSVGQPTRSTKSGRRVGLSPSAAGRPPKVVTGELRNSIINEVRREGNKIIGVVGSTSIKARRLEFGFTGRDSLGRVYSQEARPFLRPTFLENRDEIMAFLTGQRK